MHTARYKVGIFPLVVVLVLGMGSVALAAEYREGRQSAEEQVTDVVHQLHDAFNGRDADALAELYTVDTVSLEDDGSVQVGRQAIRNDFAEFIHSLPPGAVHVLAAETIKVSVEGDNAHAFGTFTFSLYMGDMLLGTSEGKFLVILRRVDGLWLTAVQMLNFMPDPPPDDEGDDEA